MIENHFRSDQFRSIPFDSSKVPQKEFGRCHRLPLIASARFSSNTETFQIILIRDCHDRSQTNTVSFLLLFLVLSKSESRTNIKIILNSEWKKRTRDCFEITLIFHNQFYVISLDRCFHLYVTYTQAQPSTIFFGDLINWFNGNWEYVYALCCVYRLCL